MRRRWAASVLAVLVWAAAGACTSASPPPSPPPTLDAPDPDPARVEAMLLLVGDAGDALPGRSPVLAAAAADVERWSARLDSGAVRVVLLGDLIYPEGLRPPTHDGHARDTLRLHAQLAPVLGTGARRAGARLDLITGNHDWAGGGGADGRARVAALAARVDAWRAGGLPVALRPAAGAPGPEVVDVGPHHRLLFLDTQAWLYASDGERRTAGEDMARALAEAGDRTVSVLTHHPLVSGGAHGLTPPSDGVVDALRSLVARTGILTQDAWSAPYQELITAMRAAFSAAPSPPLLWAAGHDHSLQLLAGTEAGDPRWHVVSGSGSRLGDVAAAPGMVMGGAWPGYARLFLLGDGSAVLQMVAGAVGAAHCPQPAADDLAACMAAGTASFHAVLSRPLR